MPGWSAAQQTACLSVFSSTYHQNHVKNTHCWGHSALAINIEEKDNFEIVFINVLLYIMYSIRAGEKETPPSTLKWDNKLTVFYKI